MKKILCVLLALSMIFAFAACSKNGSEADSASEESPSMSEQSSETEQPSQPEQSSLPEKASSEAGSASSEPAPEETTTAKSLVVYFSCTGNTKAVAEKIAELTGADLYEIVPEQEYTAADLNYNNSSCRANLEMNDPDARPAISGSIPDLSEYGTIYVGYPIWWGTMPRIINTFIESCDLSDKVIMPFCTSGGSGVSTSVADITAAAPNADVHSGLRAKGADDSAIADWITDTNE